MDPSTQTNGYNNNDVLVMRFNANGTIDNTFGNNGEFIYGSGGDFTGSGVLDPQGRILVSANLKGTTGESFLRVNPNGTLDATFGSGGIVHTGIAQYGSTLLQNAPTDPNGYKIVLGATGHPSSGHIAFEVVRFNSNGSLDTTFGNGGTTLFAPPIDPSQAAAGDTSSGASLAKLTLQADGSIVAVGSLSVYDPSGNYFADPAVVRFTANGAVDTTFGNAGSAVTIYATGQYQNSKLSDVKVDAIGNIVVVGYDTDQAGNTSVVLMRYTSTGQLDTTFGAGGTGFVFTGPGIGGVDLNIQADGSLVVSANDGKSMSLIRYMGS